jgi:hypothetical protein
VNITKHHGDKIKNHAPSNQKSSSLKILDFVEDQQFFQRHDTFLLEMATWAITVEILNPTNYSISPS